MKCPGQDMQYWTDDAIFEVNCPECDAIVEFYKDDTSRKCPKCEHRFVNPKLDFGCASYCQFAEQCLGTLPENFLGSREDLLKDKVAVLLKRHLKTDFKSIREATELARLGETICKQEGGNLAVVLCASYLHSIDQPTADDILKQSGASDILSTTIFNTITPQDASASEAIESKILADSITLYTHQQGVKRELVDDLAQTITEKDLLTAGAKKIFRDAK